MPKPDSSLSAVIVSGGKQYRVAPGDHILVDRLSAEPGSSLKLDRVLLFRNGDDIKIAGNELADVDVDVKVLAHRRGPRIESLRYKSKKRVRVHHGGRADLTALEIIAVGGITVDKTETKTASKAKAKAKAKPAPKKRAATATKAQVDEPHGKAEKAETKPPKRAPRKKDNE